MRAVNVPAPGGPEVLEIQDRPDPEPGEGQIRVRVTAATVNPTDIGFRSGAYGDLPDPATPGMELAGTVDAVGPGSRYSVGTRVFAIVSPAERSGGAQAELVVLQDDQVAATPTQFSDVEIATLPMNGTTVHVALASLGLRPGDTLGVTGASGAVGGYAVQLARAAGLRVVADAKPEDEELVRGLGATDVVPRQDDVAAAFRSAAPDGVDGLIDAAVLDDGVLGAIRDGGALATVRGFDGPTERDITISPVWVFDHVHDGTVLAALAQKASDGVLTFRVAESLPVEQVADAHRRLDAGGVRGRLVLTF